MESDAGVVVIGTGPAGAAAAWTLHRAGIPVTVLEAGSRTSAGGLTVRGPGMTLFRRRRPLPDATPQDAAPNGGEAQWIYELSAGGLSNHWTCAVPRFAPEDFTDGAALDERFRWPVGYQDLADHYSAMERLLHIAGSGLDVQHLPGGHVSHRLRLAADWGPVVEQASARGHGLTPLPLAWSGGWTVTRSGTPFNSFVRMLQDIPQSPRFRVLFGARVLRLEWSGEQRRVRRVVFRDEAGEEQALAADAFVLAAGALGSTRLLLQSRSADFPQGLGNAEGVLGRYLHDHPLAKVALTLSRPLSVHPAVLLTRGPYDDASRLRGVATILWSSTALRLRSLGTLTPGKSRRIGFNLFGMFPPSERSFVALAGGGDAAPLDIRISFDQEVQAMLLAARERLVEILEAAGHRASIDLWHVGPPGASVHYGGTARMHHSPRFGMLDGWNRLHAVPNVLVVDAAAFTTGPEKNPTLTAMALASRACEKLAADLRAGGGRTRSRVSLAAPVTAT